jgi:TRAP-type C4-dicarboxylate transport system substrate-binding protein
MRRALATLMILLTAAGCGLTGGNHDKAGSVARTLRVVVGDRTGTESHQIAALFAAEVARRSAGQITVRVDVKPTVDLPADEPTRTIARVGAGHGDVAVVNARGWRAAGVTTFEPLEVPMLVGDDGTFDAITTGTVGEAMLTGTRSAGFEPLALVPVRLRVLESYGAPFTTPADLAGTTIRTWPGGPTAVALGALGATPTWVGGFRFQANAEAGRLGGAVTALDTVHVVAPGTFLANVPVLADAVTITVATTTWAGLSAAERTIVRESATAARARWVETRTTLAQGAAAVCSKGASAVTVADAAGIDAFRAAFAPTRARVAALGTNAAVVASIASAAPEPIDTPSPCTASGGLSPTRATGDQGLLDGVWRRNMTTSEWAKRGYDAFDYSTNGGLHTWTIRAGSWLDHDQVEGAPPDGSGRIALSNGQLAITLDGETQPRFLMRFARDGDTLTISGAHGPDSLASMWNGRWRRVG